MVHRAASFVCEVNGTCLPVPSGFPFLSVIKVPTAPALICRLGFQSLVLRSWCSPGGGQTPQGIRIEPDLCILFQVLRKDLGFCFLSPPDLRKILLANQCHLMHSHDVPACSWPRPLFLWEGGYRAGPLFCACALLHLWRWHLGSSVVILASYHLASADSCPANAPS